MVSSIHLVLLLNLVLIVGSNNLTQVNLTLLTDLIQCASKYHQFQTIPILAPHQTLYEIEGFIYNLQRTIPRPMYILSRKVSHFLFRFRIHTDSLILVFFKGVADTIFEVTQTYTKGRRLTSIVFILTRPPISQLEIYDILKRTWKDHYMHALLLYRDIRGQDYLLTFNRYPEFKIKSVLGTYAGTDIFALRRNGNLDGYKIRTPVKSDLPRVFMVTDYHGQTQVKGYGYQLFMAFVKHMNATFEEYIMNVKGSSINVAIGDILEMISVGELEISLHPYAVHDVNGVGSSYPIQLGDVCVMIPMANEIPSYMYLWRPLQVKVWILLVFATFYLAATLMWISPNIEHKVRREFGLSLLQSVGYILNIATWEYYKNVSWRYFIVHKGRWILGFLITTWYCALLESYLTATVFGPQIDSMEDLIASGLKIMATDYDLELIMKLPHLPIEFKKIFIGVSGDTLAKFRTELNTSYAYVVAIDRWNFLNLQQQYSKRPIFRLSHICFYKHQLAYQLAYDSGLQYSLNFFILYAQQSGLQEYWTEVDFGYALQEGYVKLQMDSYTLQPLHGENMRLAWEVLAVGLGISAVVFFVEVLLFVKWCRIVFIFFRRLCRRIGNYPLEDMI